MTRCIGYAASSPLPTTKSGDRGQTRLRGLLDAGDPHGEVRTAWHAKETVRGIYGIDTPVLALRYTLQLADDLQHESCPLETETQTGNQVAVCNIIGPGSRGSLFWFGDDRGRRRRFRSQRLTGRPVIDSTASARSVSDGRL